MLVGMEPERAQSDSLAHPIRSTLRKVFSFRHGEHKQHSDEEKPRLYPTVPDSYELIEECGSGATSQVWKAMCKPYNEVVAIKLIRLGDTSVTMEAFTGEAQTMSQLQHPHLLPLYCSFLEGEMLWLVMPYIDVGNMATIMDAAFQQGVSESVIATVMKSVLEGLEYLHHQGIIHRDVKASNVLISRQGHVYLADFSIAAVLPQPQLPALSPNAAASKGERGAGQGVGSRGASDDSNGAKCSSFAGSICWMAPEIVEGTGYDCKADIWSFGITLLELLRGKCPLADLPAMQVMMQTLHGNSADLMPEELKCSKQLRDLLGRCLEKQPSNRPAASKLLEHKFFKDSQDSEYLVRKLLAPLPDKGINLGVHHMQQQILHKQQSVSRYGSAPGTRPTSSHGLLGQGDSVSRDGIHNRPPSPRDHVIHFGLDIFPIHSSESWDYPEEMLTPFMAATPYADPQDFPSSPIAIPQGDAVGAEGSLEGVFRSRSRPSTAGPAGGSLRSWNSRPMTPLSRPSAASSAEVWDGLDGHPFPGTHRRSKSLYVLAAEARHQQAALAGDLRRVTGEGLWALTHHDSSPHAPQSPHTPMTPRLWPMDPPQAVVVENERRVALVEVLALFQEGEALQHELAAQAASAHAAALPEQQHPGAASSLQPFFSQMHSWRFPQPAAHSTEGPRDPERPQEPSSQEFVLQLNRCDAVGSSTNDDDGSGSGSNRASHGGSGTSNISSCNTTSTTPRTRSSNLAPQTSSGGSLLNPLGSSTKDELCAAARPADNARNMQQEAQRTLYHETSLPEVPLAEDGTDGKSDAAGVGNAVVAAVPFQVALWDQHADALLQQISGGDRVWSSGTCIRLDRELRSSGQSSTVTVLDLEANELRLGRDSRLSGLAGSPSLSSTATIPAMDRASSISEVPSRESRLSGLPGAASLSSTATIIATAAAVPVSDIVPWRESRLSGLTANASHSSTATAQATACVLPLLDMGTGRTGAVYTAMLPAACGELLSVREEPAHADEPGCSEDADTPGRQLDSMEWADWIGPVDGSKGGEGACCVDGIEGDTACPPGRCAADERASRGNGNGGDEGAHQVCCGEAREGPCVDAVTRHGPVQNDSGALPHFAQAQDCYRTDERSALPDEACYGSAVDISSSSSVCCSKDAPVPSFSFCCTVNKPVASTGATGTGCLTGTTASEPPQAWAVAVRADCTATSTGFQPASATSAPPDPADLLEGGVSNSCCADAPGWLERGMHASTAAAHASAAQQQPASMNPPCASMAANSHTGPRSVARHRRARSMPSVNVQEDAAMRAAASAAAESVTGLRQAMLYDRIPSGVQAMLVDRMPTAASLDGAFPRRRVLLDEGRDTSSSTESSETSPRTVGRTDSSAGGVERGAWPPSGGRPYPPAGGFRRRSVERVDSDSLSSSRRHLTRMTSSSTTSSVASRDTETLLDVELLLSNTVGSLLVGERGAGPTRSQAGLKVAAQPVQSFGSVREATAPACPCIQEGVQYKNSDGQQ